MYGQYQPPMSYQPFYQPPMQDQLMQLRQQYQPQQPPQPMAQMPQPAQSMIWVQGDAGAKSYLVAAGNTVPLWDSENPCIYIKSVDASGVPSMRILDYTERTGARTPAQPIIPTGGEFVTRKEFEAMEARVDALVAKKTVKPKEDKENGEPTV